jgi:hypothetical protein
MARIVFTANIQRHVADEHGPVADIASVMEISGEQRFDTGAPSAYS